MKTRDRRSKTQTGLNRRQFLSGTSTLAAAGWVTGTAGNWALSPAWASTDGPIKIGTLPSLIPTGIAIAAPPGTDLQVRPRSGLFARGVVGSVGTIDADFRGEIFVTLYCLPDLGSFEINDGTMYINLDQTVSF